MQHPHHRKSYAYASYDMMCGIVVAAEVAFPPPNEDLSFYMYYGGP